MMAQDLQHRLGEALSAALQPHGLERLSPAAPTRVERTLDGDFIVELTNGARVPVTPAGREAKQALARLADRPDEALLWYADHTLHALSFSTVRRHALDPLLLEDQVHQALPGAAHFELTRWFAEEFLLEGGLLVRGELAGKFSLFGQRLRWDVERRPEGLVVHRAAPNKHQRQREVTWLRLDQPPTLASLAAVAIEARLASGVNEAADPYFEIWQNYLEIEQQTLEERSQRLGKARFTRGQRDPLRNRIVLHLAGDNLGAWLAEEARFSICLHDGLGGRPRDLGIANDLKRADEGATLEIAPPDFQLPDQGELSLSSHGDEVRLGRQQAALDRLKGRQTSMPDLAAVLDGTGRTLSTGRTDRWRSKEVLRQLGGRPLTAAQQRAVEVALNSPDIALIQGPPGTGKTTVVRVILNRLHELGRGCALVASAQHDAVLRVVDGLEVSGVPTPRLGGRREEALESSVKPLRRWLDRVRAHTAHRLTRIPTPPRLSHLNDARRHLAHHQATQAPLEMLPALVSALRGGLATLSDAGVQAALVALEAAVDAARPTDDVAVSVDVTLLRERLDAQLTVPERFADGGWLRARQLRLALGAWPAPADARAMLDEACTAAQMPADFPAAVAAMRQHLEHPPPPPDHGKAQHDALKALDLALEQAATRHQATVPDALTRFLRALDEQTWHLPTVLSRYSAAIGATLQQSARDDVREPTSERSAAGFPTVIVDEAARANPLDLLIPLVNAERIVLVGDQNQLPHMLEPAVERILDGGQGGDAAAVLKQAFFSRLWDRYDAAPPGGIPRCVRLDVQFRMHPTIGTFISETFYGGGLSNGITDRDRPPVPGLCGSRTVGWIDVPYGAEQGRYHRPEEVKVVADLVDQALDADRSVTVGVISFYQQQVKRLEARQREAGWPDRVEVGTVDAFQGKEFDVVILSTVRRGQQVGFLRLPNRLNVAMSRAMRTLVVVGDHRTVRVIPALDAFHTLCRAEGYHHVR